MIYTQEPWEIQNGNTDSYIIAKDGNGKHVTVAQVFQRGIAGCETKGNACLMKAAPKMFEALQRIMALDDSGILEAMAYSGGDIPKKWMREEAPAIDAKSKAIKEIKEIIRPILAKAEGRADA